MIKNYTWLGEIIEAMKDLGGHAHYSDLYEAVKDRGNIKFDSKDPKAQIRGTIERHSSDSSVYKKYYKNQPDKDIFYSVYGKGKGHWGLRNFEPSNNCVDITDDDEGFKEGKKKLRIHVCRERNYKVIKEAKARYKERYGKLICQICKFDFEGKYGDIGKDFIEGHHMVPISQLNEGDKTKVNDIILVCSNCHKMLHRKRPWLKPNELEKLIIQ